MSLLHASGNLEATVRNMYNEYWNALPGQKFSCPMLVDGSCDEVCDWELALYEAHDFSRLCFRSHDPVLVFDPSGNTVLKAEFLDHGVTTMPQQRCVSQSRETPFPLS